MHQVLCINVEFSIFVFIIYIYKSIFIFFDLTSNCWKISLRHIGTLYIFNVYFGHSYSITLKQTDERKRTGKMNRDSGWPGCCRLLPRDPRIVRV